MELRRGAHLPSQGHWARRWVCDTWPVRRQTYLPSHRASPPCGRYQFTLLGEQRHMCVNNLPRVERPGVEPATYWLQVRCPNHYTTTPHHVHIRGSKIYRIRGRGGVNYPSLTLKKLIRFAWIQQVLYVGQGCRPRLLTLDCWTATDQSAFKDSQTSFSFWSDVLGSSLMIFCSSH